MESENSFEEAEPFYFSYLLQFPSHLFHLFHSFTCCKGNLFGCCFLLLWFVCGFGCFCLVFFVFILPFASCALSLTGAWCTDSSLASKKKEAEPFYKLS